MERLSHPVSRGLSRPTYDEAHSTPHAAGPKDQNTQSSNFKQNREELQASDNSNAFERLSRQFEKIGLRLYWLNSPSVLVSAPKLGMSLSLPDLRTAKIYLSQIGGAA